VKPKPDKPCWDLQPKLTDKIPMWRLMEMFNTIPPNTEFQANIINIFGGQCVGIPNVLTATVAEYDQYGMIISLSLSDSSNTIVRFHPLCFSFLHIFWSDFTELLQKWPIQDRIVNSRNRMPKGSTFQVIIKEMTGRDPFLPISIRLQPALNPRVDLKSLTLPLAAASCLSRYLVCIDFEATCDYAPVPLVNTHSAEIIEFPWVVIDTKTMRVVDSQQCYVKPDNMTGVTSFTSKLTGITTDMLVEQEGLASVLKKFHDYLKGNYGFNFRILTDGIWDLQVQLRNEARRKNIPLDWYFHQYFDIKHEFTTFLPYFDDSYQPSLKTMLQAFGMQFEGRHHSGLHDAKNVARLALYLISLGHPFEKCNVILPDYDCFQDKKFVDFGQVAESNSWLCNPCGIWNRPWAKTCKFCHKLRT
jgi:inhibitor of KinA sporulation pathway (predicted exonuclease)